MNLVGLGRLWPSHIRADSQGVTHSESVVSEVPIGLSPRVLDDPVLGSITNQDDGVVDLAGSLVGQDFRLGTLELRVGVYSDREGLFGESSLHSVAISVSDVSEP